MAGTAQHGHAEDRVEPALSPQDTVARIDEANPVAAVLHGLEQDDWIDLRANDLGFGKVVGERDAFLSARAAERQNAARVRCGGGSSGENFGLAVERGPVRPLVATGVQQRGDLGELAAPYVVEEAFATHTAPPERSLCLLRAVLGDYADGREFSEIRDKRDAARKTFCC
jgi:hypothetical protein